MGRLVNFCAGVERYILPARHVDAVLLNVPDDACSDSAINSTKRMLNSARAMDVMMDSGGFQLHTGELDGKRITFDENRPLIRNESEINITPLHVMKAAAIIKPDIIVGLDFPIRKISDPSERKLEFMRKLGFNVVWTKECFDLWKKLCPDIRFFVPIQCYDLDQLDLFNSMIAGVEYHGFSMPDRNMTLKSIILFMVRFYQMGIRQVHILGTSKIGIIAITAYMARNFFDWVSFDATTWRLGYMFLLKEGGDCLPDISNPIFNDLFEIIQRENQLNNGQSQMIAQGNKHSVCFTDDDFRKATGLQLSPSGILALLLETSRVEFKLTFPVRLRSTNNKQNIHRMNYFSRFFELAYEDVDVRSDGIVKKRRYRVIFNTLLGELFINNLLARFNDRIDIKFYLLLDSAQIFYRRALLHHNLPRMEIHLITIAEYVGLRDSNISNLSKTVERNILEPLKDYGYIEPYEKTEGLNGIKYIITRSNTTSNKRTSDKQGR